MKWASLSAFYMRGEQDIWEFPSKFDRNYTDNRFALVL